MRLYKFLNEMPNLPSFKTGVSAMIYASIAQGQHAPRIKAGRKGYGSFFYVHRGQT